jgi:hypothetical protein
MYSNLVPFQNIVEIVKDDIGITNLRNQYPKLRRYIHRVERDIGFGGTLILKRVQYSLDTGTIFIDENGFGKIRLPEDLVVLETVGMCYEGWCPKDYKYQGNYLFLCRYADSFNLMYYALICDGEGNPAISENHFEAVVAGIKYFMYQPKMWNNEGNHNFYRQLKQEYHDACGEAVGDDVFPSTKKEWEQIASLMRMSQRDILIYNSEEDCYCCFPESENKEILNPSTDNSDDMVYYWQYSDLSKDILDAPNIDQAFLDLQNSENVESFINGFVVPYSLIGRIGFAITNVDEDYYQIIDVFETDITDVAFDKYYDAANRIQIYISKEIYSHGNIYYKLILN